MTTLRTALAISLVSASALALPAQSDRENDSPFRPQLVPLHSQPDDPVFGPYGTWAAGRDYKVRVAPESVRVVPLLGREAARTLSITWRTQDVTVGGDSLIAGRAPHARIAAPTRYEVGRGAVVEAWDVRADGVEQTFAIARRPAGVGDLVVRGSLVGDGLSTAPVAEAIHGALTWTDARGTPILRYGAAYLLDAAGTKHPLPTRFVDGELSLTVPAAMLEQAVFPIVIDPIVDPLTIATGAHDDPVEPAVATVSGTRAYAWTIAASAFDQDLLVATEASLPATIFADLDTMTTALTPDLGFAEGPQRFIVAWSRASMTLVPQARIRVALVDDPAVVPSPGATTVVLPAFTPAMGVPSQDWKPSIGGTGSGSVCQIVAESEDSISFLPPLTTPMVRGLWLDAGSGNVAFGPFDLAGPNAFDPDSLPMRDPDAAQFVTVYELRQPSQDVIAARSVRLNFTMSPELTLEAQSNLFGTLGRPQVAGGDAEYCATWTDSSLFGTETRVARFRLPFASDSIQDLRTVTYPDLQCRSLAFDSRTGSHWAAAVDDDGADLVSVLRIGWDGGETDLEEVGSTTLTNFGAQARIAFDPTDPGGSFVVSYRQTNLLSGISSRRIADYRYPAATTTTIVPGCGTGSLTATRPIRGNHSFRLGVANIGPMRPALPLVTLLPANPPIALDFIGIAGCDLGVDLAFQVPLPGVVSNQLGSASLQIPLPEPLDFDFYAQWVYVDPAVMGLLRLTEAVRLEVR